FHQPFVLFVSFVVHPRQRIPHVYAESMEGGHAGPPLRGRFRRQRIPSRAGRVPCLSRER
ncbi:MAG: hypothetical protein RBU37_15950, partial [Myxococcota bacterium]|nr:hypothetical protein [Myxococcota bacterium]